MVKIPTATQGIQTPRAASRRGIQQAPRDLQTPAQERALAATSRATQALGTTIARTGASVGDTLSVLAQKERIEQDKIADFDANNRFLEFKTAQQKAARDLREQAHPSGVGYTKDMLTEYKGQADTFADSVPERLKDKYDTKLHQLEQSLLLEGDTFERASKGVYYKDVVEKNLTTLANSVRTGQTPSQEATQEGLSLITAAELPRSTKQVLADSWQKESAAAGIQRSIAVDPVGAFFDLGGGTPDQRIGMQKQKLFGAMIQRESSGDPLAISPKGAVGLMQVTPPTAGDIARELGDESFPTGGSPEEITSYLQQPNVNKQYGEYYMNKQLEKYNGDVEAALIAYNAGPGNADKWLAAGRNYAALPKPEETAPYVRDILGTIGSAPTGRYQFGAIGVTAGDYRSRYYNWADVRTGAARGEPMDRAAAGALDDVTDKFGKGALSIAMGTRADNVDALTINVGDYSEDEKSRLVGLFVAAGVRGFKQDDNQLTVDFRTEPGKGRGGLAVGTPVKKRAEWFANGLQQGLASEGRAMVATGPTDQTHLLFDYDQQEEFRGDAQTAATKQVTKIVDDEIAALENTGQTLGLLRPEHMQFVSEENREKLLLAGSKYRVNQAIEGARVDQLSQILPQLAPNPKKPDFEQQQKLYDYAKDAIKTRRDAIRKDPFAAMLADNDTLAQQWQAAVDSDDPANVREMSGVVFAQQERAGVPVNQRRLFPKSHIKPIADAVTDPNLSLAERIAPARDLIFATEDPATRFAIFEQLRENGVPEQTEIGFEALARGDDAAAQRLLTAALVQPKDLPGTLPPDVKRADIVASVRDKIMSEGQIGDAYYGLDNGVIENFTRASADATVMHNAVSIRVRQGESLNDATDAVIRDMFGDVQVVQSGDNMVLIPDDEDAGDLISRFGAARRSFKPAIERVTQTVKDQLKEQPDLKGLSDKVLDAIMDTRAEQILGEAVLRSVDGGVGLFVPSMGAFIMDDKQRPMTLSLDEIKELPPESIAEELQRIREEQTQPGFF